MRETKLSKSEESWITFEHPLYKVNRKVYETTETFTNNGNPNSIRNVDFLEVSCKKCGSIRTIKSRCLYRKHDFCRQCPKRKSTDKIGEIVNGLKILGIEHRPYGKTERSFWIYECQICKKTLSIRLGSESKYASKFHGCNKCRNKRGQKFRRPSKPKTLAVVFKSLQRGASTRGLAFDLTAEDLLTILDRQDHRCCLSGQTITIEDGTASLDRKDNDLGYTLENAQWLYKPINFMKGSFDQTYFLELCRMVSSV